MAVSLSLYMGVEGVSYQPATEVSQSDYPNRKINLPVGASVPSHVGNVFNLDVTDQILASAIRPRISNPFVTVPANYAKLFNDIEAATGNADGARGETGRIMQSARALLLSMKSDFEAFDSARNALIKA